MDFQDGILENTISYLFKISEALPNNLSIPKSYYASKSRILELKGQTSLPAKLTKETVRCPRCCLNFKDYPPNIELKPKRKKDRFTKKMLKKMEEGKSLTSYQQKFCTLLSKISDQNIMLKTCRFCKREIKTNVKFQIEKRKKKVNEDTLSIPQNKKKKGKDKYAGLIPSAVETVKKSQGRIKKNVLQLLNENKEGKEIKHNVIGSIGDKKKKKKRPKRNTEVIPVKSTKMKIMEKKEKKANLKNKDKIKNLLSGANKPNASNVLNGFLQTL